MKDFFSQISFDENINKETADKSLPLDLSPIDNLKIDDDTIINSQINQTDGIANSFDLSIFENQQDQNSSLNSDALLNLDYISDDSNIKNRSNYQLDFPDLEKLEALKNDYSNSSFSTEKSSLENDNSNASNNLQDSSSLLSTSSTATDNFQSQENISNSPSSASESELKESVATAEAIATEINQNNYEIDFPSKDYNATLFSENELSEVEYEQTITELNKNLIYYQELKKGVESIYNKYFVPDYKYLNQHKEVEMNNIIGGISEKIITAIYSNKITPEIELIMKEANFTIDQNQNYHYNPEKFREAIKNNSIEYENEEKKYDDTLIKSLKITEFSSWDNYVTEMQNLELAIQEYNALIENTEAKIKIIPYLKEASTSNFKEYEYTNLKISTKDILAYTTEDGFDYNTYKKETKNVISPLDYYYQFKQTQIEGINNLAEAAKINKTYGKLYNYYYYNYGEEKANSYLKDMTSEINKTVALKNVNDFLTSLPVDSTISDVQDRFLKITGKGLFDGLQQYAQGIISWFDSSREKTILDYESMYIVQALYPNEDKELLGLINNGKSISNVIDFTKDYSGRLDWSDDVYQISSGIGNMIPSISLGVFRMPILSSLSLGTSAGGNSYHDAMINGYDQSKAIFYGLLSGSSEVIFERLLGSIPGLSDVNITSAKTFVQAMLKEGNEEGIEEVFDIIIRYGLFGETITEEEFLNRVGQSALYGAITSGVLNGTGKTIGLTVNSFQQIFKAQKGSVQNTESQTVQQSTENGQQRIGGSETNTTENGTITPPAGKGEQQSLGEPNSNTSENGTITQPAGEGEQQKIGGTETNTTENGTITQPAEEDEQKNIGGSENNITIDFKNDLLNILNSSKTINEKMTNINEYLVNNGLNEINSTILTTQLNNNTPSEKIYKFIKGEIVREYSMVIKGKDSISNLLENNFNAFKTMKIIIDALKNDFYAKNSEKSWANKPKGFAQKFGEYLKPITDNLSLTEAVSIFDQRDYQIAYEKIQNRLSNKILNQINTFNTLQAVAIKENLDRIKNQIPIKNYLEMLNLDKSSLESNDICTQIYDKLVKDLLSPKIASIPDSLKNSYISNSQNDNPNTEILEKLLLEFNSYDNIPSQDILALLSEDKISAIIDKIKTGRKELVKNIARNLNIEIPDNQIENYCNSQFRYKISSKDVEKIIKLDLLSYFGYRGLNSSLVYQYLTYVGEFPDNLNKNNIANIVSTLEKEIEAKKIEKIKNLLPENANIPDSVIKEVANRNVYFSKASIIEDIINYGLYHNESYDIKGLAEHQIKNLLGDLVNDNILQQLDYNNSNNNLTYANLLNQCIDIILTTNPTITSEQVCQKIAENIELPTVNSNEVHLDLSRADIEHIVKHILIYNPKYGQNGGGHYYSRLLGSPVISNNSDLEHSFSNVQIDVNGTKYSKTFWPNSFSIQKILDLGFTAYNIGSTEEEINDNGNCIYNYEINPNDFENLTNAKGDKIIIQFIASLNNDKISTIYPLINNS